MNMAHTLSGKVIWLIGLPNGGKSAIARPLKPVLEGYYANTILIDGDDLRAALKMTQTHYDLKSRTENGYRIGRLAKMFADQGACVVVAANTLFKEVQEWNRANLDYFEVFIDADETTRRARDGKKQLYARFDRGEVKDVLGIDLPPDIPQSPDLVLGNTLESKVEDHIQAILVGLHLK